MARTILLGFLSIMLVIAVIRQPDEAFQASLQGLTIWWNIVFPGLLPFLVLFEIIAAFGLIHGLGVLLQPIMRTIFKLPGEAILPILFGWMSGYSAGADTTAALRRSGALTKQEGQRLLALSHMPNPLFILVVIGAGFLHRPELGVYIVAIVWLSALWTSAALRLFQRTDTNTAKQDGNLNSTNEPKQNLLVQAGSAITIGREKDGRGFGKLLGEAVSASVQKLMVIGGFMIFAAVVARLAQPLIQFAVPHELLNVALPALLESHIGAYAAAVWQGPDSNPAITAAAVAAVLAWSSVSGILQAGYSIAGTDLKLLPFIGARLLHAFHAAFFGLMLWKPAQSVFALLPFSESSSHPALLPEDGITLQPVYPPSLNALDLPSLWPLAISGAVLLAVAFMILLFLKPPVRRLD